MSEFKLLKTWNLTFENWIFPIENDNITECWDSTGFELKPRAVNESFCRFRLFFRQKLCEITAFSLPVSSNAKHITLGFITVLTYGSLEVSTPVASFLTAHEPNQYL